MTEKEALTRIKIGDFGGKYGFDMQLLIDTVGTIGEMFRNGQINEVVQCKDCINRYDSINCRMCSEGMNTSDGWFCADGKRW